MKRPLARAVGAEVRRRDALVAAERLRELGGLAVADPVRDLAHGQAARGEHLGRLLHAHPRQVVAERGLRRSRRRRAAAGAARRRRGGRCRPATGRRRTRGRRSPRPPGTARCAGGWLRLVAWARSLLRDGPVRRMNIGPPTCQKWRVGARSRSRIPVADDDRQGVVGALAVRARRCARPASARRRRRPARGEIAPSIPSVIITSTSPRRQRHRRRAHARHPVADHAAEDERDVLAQLRPGAHQPRVDVADARPGQLAALEVEPGERSSPTPRVSSSASWQRSQQLLRRAPRRARARPPRTSRRRRPPPGRGRARRSRHASAAGARSARTPRGRPSASSPSMRRARDAAVERRGPRLRHCCVHLTSVTVVPCPGAVSMSNSSTSRRAPGSPSPSPPPVV